MKMKYMNYLIIRILFMVLVPFILFNCSQDENIFEKGGPEIRPLIPLDTFKQERNLVVSVGIELRAITGLDNLKVYKNNELYDEANYEEEQLIETYNFEYTVENFPDGTLIEFVFELTDQAGMEATPFRFFVQVGPPFSVESQVIFGENVLEVTGRINRDTIFRKNNTYLINGLVSVEGNKTLTIEPGTTILMKTFDDTRSSRLAITQGSRINAVGTKDAPIVFTSDRTLNGTADWEDWGGIFVYGKAPTNQASLVFEEGFFYGGNVLNDNSGKIKYVRIEYTGKSDADAIQFYGVGSSTEISHLCIWYCFDNAVRFKGGGADVKYLVVIDHGAYGLWAEHGWRGRGQFWVFQTQIAATIIPINFNNIARSVELRNDPNDFNLQPATYGRLSNFTLIGNGNTVADGTRRGMRIRRGARALAKNIIVTNFPDDGVRVEDLPTEVLQSGSMTLQHIRSFNNGSNYDEQAEDFFAADPQYDVNEIPVTGITPDNFVGSEPSPFDPALDPDFGSWFTSAPFIGAIENEANDWTADGSWVRNQDGSIR